jgi:hypothetical protein
MKEPLTMKKNYLYLSCLLILSHLSGCGVTPTRIGEGVRSVIDHTEDNRTGSDQKIYFRPATP